MRDQVEREAFGRVVRHFQSGTTDLAESDVRLPGSIFVDPDRAQAEVALLRRLPLVAAHSNELREPGCFVTRSLLGTPVIIARQSDGSVQAYLNICLHRGAPVEREVAGRKRVFMCGYHGWTYDRDGGTLRGVPYQASFDSVDLKCERLTRIGAEDRHGLIWVVLERGFEQSVSSFLGADVDEQLAAHCVDDLVPYHAKTYEVRSNWKIVMDGANDILHVRFLHPGSVGDFYPMNCSVLREWGRHSRTFAPRGRLKEVAVDVETPEDLWKYVVSSLRAYPNTMLNSMPDQIELWTVWPSPGDPGASTVRILLLVPPDSVQDQRVVKRLDRSVQLLEQALLAEDFPMGEAIQANLAAHPETKVRYGRSECVMQSFHRTIQDDLDTMKGF